MREEPPVNPDIQRDACINSKRLCEAICDSKSACLCGRSTWTREAALIGYDFIWYMFKRVQKGPESALPSPQSLPTLGA